uniref:DUF4313 domain-containing protein n=1 Tax=Panagrellus redivivus TaxID=6233 RepID=A0A7E4W7C2_PANRE
MYDYDIASQNPVQRIVLDLTLFDDAYSIQVAAPNLIPFCQPVKVTTVHDYSTNYLKFDGRNNQFYDESNNAVTLGDYIREFCL